MPAWYDIENLSDGDRLAMSCDGMEETKQQSTPRLSTSLSSLLHRPSPPPQSSRSFETRSLLVLPPTKSSSVVSPKVVPFLPLPHPLPFLASSGGAAALHVGYTFEQELAGVVCLSAYLPQKDEFAKQLAPANKNTELFMCHGGSSTPILSLAFSLFSSSVASDTLPQSSTLLSFTSGARSPTRRSVRWA